MAAENSRILLGLPNLPADTIDPKFWSEFLTIYRAIENLLRGVSEFTGIDSPDSIEVNGMDPTKYLQGANLEMWYPVAAVAISRGQVVMTSPGLGSNTVQLAQANVATNMAIGVADETKGIGARIKILTGGLTTAFSGMIPGTLYYLATGTAGAIQNLRPVTAGQIIQPIGWALSSNQMLLRISSYYQQL